ncbi:MAG: hypothetical protein L3V56_10530 [Candidatus Magnetoovum sp. WYHC-5]|nr:hypothetical protein [Candidatus Magnetoovum sp. WYHC-5]
MIKRYGLVVAIGLLFLNLSACHDVTRDVEQYGIRKRTLMESKLENPTCENRIFIEPKVALGHKKHVVVFQIKSPLDAKPIATSMTDSLRDNLLTKQTFRVVEANYEIFNSLDDYFQYARKLNYDYIIISEITNIVDGGTHRQSMMTLKTRLIEPNREVTLLYMENCITADPSTFLSYYELKASAMPAPSPQKLGEALVSKASKIIDDFSSGLPVE